MKQPIPFSVVTAPSVNSFKNTLCLKKRPNFETVQLEIIRIDFDAIW